jgi:phosphoserine phosphatase
LDVDGTWYRKQLFEALIDVCVDMGVMPRLVPAMVEKERTLAKRREIPYDDFIWKLVRAYQDHERLRGVRVADLTLCAQRLMEGRGGEVHVFTRELALAAHDVGMQRAIISGSPLQAIQEFARVNGIRTYLGTEHPYDAEGYFTGGRPLQHFLHKDRAVLRLAIEHGFDLERSFAIGDSISDADMFRLVGHPICFNPEAKLWPLARAHRWPVVMEVKNAITIHRADARAAMHEVPLSEVLPGPLAARLTARLVATGWYTASGTVGPSRS